MHTHKCNLKIFICQLNYKKINSSSKKIRSKCQNQVKGLVLVKVEHVIKIILF